MSSENHPELTGAAIQTSAPPDSKGSSPPIGAIVGGAVGGAVLLVGVAFAFWFLYRRKSSEGAQELRRRRNSILSETTQVPGDVAVKYTPLVLHPQPLQPRTSIYDTLTSVGSRDTRPMSTYTTSPTSHGHTYAHTVRQSTIAGSPPHDTGLYLPENNIQPFLLSSPQTLSPPVSDGGRSGIANSPPRKGAVVFNSNDPSLGVNRSQEHEDSDGQMDYFTGDFRTPPRNPPAYTYYPEAGSSSHRESSLLFSGSSDGQMRSTSGQFSPSVISDSGQSGRHGRVQSQQYYSHTSSSPSGPMSRRTSAMTSPVSVGYYGSGLEDVEIA
ncbi:hypothetical protein PQX77_012108 [Marasmius sp. AFHP31]|nr:hypothetical protein PQX77_012108 [Marasmius sp. AFHP31]